MKVIHIESGLGNQMLSYCEYLAMKKANPLEKIYVENIIFDIPECNDVICQWNGYELDNVFKINAPNIKDIFTPDSWKKILELIRQSKFWERNWNYPVHFTNAFKEYGVSLENLLGDFEEPSFYLRHNPNRNSFIYQLKQTLPALKYKMWRQRRSVPISRLDCQSKLFVESEKDLFAGQQLLFKYKGSGIERIEKEIREVFVFPEINDPENAEAMEYINSHNAVAIHARRGDMLGFNYPCYVTGYFKRAVNYIRKHTSNPVFFIFCDPDSVRWAMENSNILGLNMQKDEVRFVDWNKSCNSYRDMQLMSACKHQVITNSTFGWWGAWFNQNPDKITCSPDFKINTTHTF